MPTSRCSIFPEARRIAASDRSLVTSDYFYLPLKEDVLRAHTMTIAIKETRFSMGQLSIHMIDVGGQRSERKSGSPISRASLVSSFALHCQNTTRSYSKRIAWQSPLSSSSWSSTLHQLAVVLAHIDHVPWPTRAHHNTTCIHII